MSHRRSYIYLALIAVNVIVYLLQPPLTFALWPWGDEFHWWQFFTYSFMHDNPVHLFFNMFVLFIFARDVELELGQRQFLMFYFWCVLGAGLVTWKLVDGPIVGASGGVFGLLMAYGLGWPNRKIWFFLILMKVKYAMGILVLIELYIGGPANYGHLGGMVYGLLYLMWFVRRPNENYRS